jgi:hypothetical protein
MLGVRSSRRLPQQAKKICSCRYYIMQWELTILYAQVLSLFCYQSIRHPWSVSAQYSTADAVIATTLIFQELQAATLV